MRKEGIAKEFHISKGTVVNRMREIEKEIELGRYGAHTLIQDGNIVLINVLVFLDFLTYRQRLLNKNLRKSVPEYRPDVVMREMGWSNRVGTVDT